MSYVTGKTIKELRERKKDTQKELAQKIGVSDKTILTSNSYWCNIYAETTGQKFLPINLTFVIFGGGYVVERDKKTLEKCSCGH